jgi:hypothetical protein
MNNEKVQTQDIKIGNLELEPVRIKWLGIWFWSRTFSDELNFAVDELKSIYDTYDVFVSEAKK